MTRSGDDPMFIKAHTATMLEKAHTYPIGAEP